MDKYYYFAAQLPFLKFGEHSFINRDYFLQEAGKWLSEKDFLVLSRANINDSSFSQDTPWVLREYCAFEHNVREELFLFRKSAKVNMQYRPPPALEKIISGGTPLEVETNLLRLRWKFIEEIEFSHYSDLGFLILYFLKIQILERLFSFNKEKGMAEFEKLSQVSL